MRKLYLIIFAAILSFQAAAQADIKFTTLSDSVTITAGDTIIINDSIYNTGNQTYQGTIGFGGSVRHPGGADTTIGGSGGFDSTGVSLPPDTGGLNKMAVIIHIPTGGNPYFVSGPNLIVVWPIYTATPGGNQVPVGPNDTLRVIAVIAPLGLDEVPLAKMYLIQRSASLNIQFGDYQNLVQQVSLYNIQGKLMYAGPAEQSQHIPTGNWSEGIYFCQITTYKGEKRTIKFMLQQ